MRFALLGLDEDTLALARWIDASSDHELVAVCDAADRPDLAAVFPHVSFSHPWEELLLGSVADAVIVAGSDNEELRSEQLRRLVTEGMPLIVSHPAVDSVLVYYELAAMAEEYGTIGIAYPLARSHPALQQACDLVRRGEQGPLGALQQVIFQRALVDRRPIDVRRHFARDVDAIRVVCGEIIRVGAAGAPRDDSAYANVGVQMSSPSGLIARWAVEPADAAPHGTLTLRGSLGSAVLQMPSVGPWSLEVTASGESTRQEFATWDSRAAAVDQLAARVAGEAVGPDWNDALRSMELTDALRRSVVKGRTVEIKLSGETEQGTFKGVMTSVGCSLIMLAVGILVLGAFVNFMARLAGQDVLAEAVANALPFVLLAMFVVFLALQVLRLFVRSDTEDDEPSGPPDS
jgi:predicted dehydrogenase